MNNGLLGPVARLPIDWLNRRAVPFYRPAVNYLRVPNPSNGPLFSMRKYRPYMGASHENPARPYMDISLDLAAGALGIGAAIALDSAWGLLAGTVGVFSLARGVSRIKEFTGQTVETPAPPEVMEL